MQKKIAIAFAGILLMLTASFAPITRAPIPGVNTYVTMAGKADSLAYMFVGAVPPNTRLGPIALPMKFPFVTRAPWLKPLQLLEQISFGPPMDLGGLPGPEIVQVQVAPGTPIVHYAWVAFRNAWWRFSLIQIAPGGGVIFLKGPGDPMAGDVDVYTFNNDSGVFWGVGPTGPSPLAGKFAAASGGHYKLLLGDFSPPMALRFPSAGADGIPGTSLWGDPLDGFGDGTPDPVGSSIIMVPVVAMGHEWNGTGWEQTLAIPMPLVLTTGFAFDQVLEAASPLFGLASLETGKAWENLATTLNPLDPKANVEVTYVAAWSNMLYCLNPDDDGDCVPDPEEGTGWTYTVDSFYEYVEKKVRIDQVVADINCDDKVDILDIGLVCKAFGTWDECLGPDGLPGTADDIKVADAKFDARADVDSSNCIQIFDLVRVALDFGKSVN